VNAVSIITSFPTRVSVDTRRQSRLHTHNTHEKIDTHMYIVIQSLKKMDKKYTNTISLTYECCVPVHWRDQDM